MGRRSGVTLVWVLSTCLTFGGGLWARASQLVTDAHIQHIEGDILPAVIVNGKLRSKVTLQERMTAFKVPGLSIAFIHDGRVLWARGYGVSREGGPPVTPQTLFQAASISKIITAVGALEAVQSGNLPLDGDVNQYLKSWKIPGNSFTDQTKVSLRQLLSHTGGITVHGFAGYPSSAAVPSLTQVLDGVPPANNPAIQVDMLPGTQWRYSGGGYVIVEQLLEDVTGHRFSRYMKETVLSPLAMTHSTFDQPLAGKDRANVAVPYGPDGQAVEGGPHIYPEEAPAGLWTTPSDLARYAIGVQRSLHGKSALPLSQDMTRQMLTPSMNSWGLGPAIGGSPEHRYFWHQGANEGYRCSLIAYEDGDGAVLMTNSDNGVMLINEVLGTIAHEYAWPDFRPTTHTVAKVDPRTFDLVAGSYLIAPDFILTFTRDGNHFFSQGTHQGPVEIFPDNEHQYFSAAVGAVMSFERDSQGQPARLVLHQGNRVIMGTRLDDAEAKKQTGN